MNTVKVKNVEIGTGLPKIIVPIVGRTKEEILAAAKSFEDVAMDIVEWRVDWFEGVFDFARVQDCAQALRKVLKIHLSYLLSVLLKKGEKKPLNLKIMWL